MAATPVTVAYRPDSKNSDNDTVRRGFAADPYNIVRHNMCSQADADKVWDECLLSWDLDESTADERDELLNYIATACAISTSKDAENLATTFTVAQKVVTLRDINDHMAFYCQGSNDSYLRIFVRCWKKGKLVMLQHNLLADPANSELRDTIAGRICGQPEHAKFMFDTADYLPYAGLKLNADELGMITRFRAVRTAAAADSARASGDVLPRNDKTLAPVVNRTMPSRAPVVNSTPDGRMGVGGFSGGLR